MVDLQHHAQTLEQIQACCQALDDKKAAEMRLLFVGEQSSITDFLVVATGTSEPHLKAMRNAVEECCRDHGIELVKADRATASGWVVLDGFDFVIHLFTEEMRELYKLEALWKDAERLPVTLADGPPRLVR